MNYKGTIIEESLADKSVLKQVKILKTKVERVTPKHMTPWIKKWTLHTIEVSEEKAAEIAELLSWSFDASHPQWYADYKNDEYHFIVYNGQIFKVDRSNQEEYKEARDYGIAIGIPEHQLDFSPLLL